jgi:hypothetical protein
MKFRMLLQNEDCSCQPWWENYDTDTWYAGAEKPTNIDEINKWVPGFLRRRNATIDTPIRVIIVSTEDSDATLA